MNTQPMASDMRTRQKGHGADAALDWWCPSPGFLRACFGDFLAHGCCICAQAPQEPAHQIQLSSHRLGLGAAIVVIASFGDGGFEMSKYLV